MILEIAKIIGEDEVRFLMSIKDRYGYRIVEDAWHELREAIRENRSIRSRKKFLNYLIQQRINKNNER